MTALTKGALNKTLVLFFLLLLPGLSARADTDVSNRDWWYLLRRGELSLSDTTVRYPKFIKFCVDVYNWGDRTFNTYEPEYVEGTGKKWKIRLVNDNWSDSYVMRYRGKDFHIGMLSNLNLNVGAYLNFMAVSVGYSIDFARISGDKPRDTSRFDTNFNCALFNLDLYYYKNEGGTYIRTFSELEGNKPIKVFFPGVKMKDFGINGYYFFNHGRYSQGAAYNFSRIQKKSAGSWMAGLSYCYININMDFSQLDEDLRNLYTFGEKRLIFNYHSFSLLGGYGYNWVIHPKWLVNVTALPSVGINKCDETNTDGNSELLSLNFHGKASITYNHLMFFAGVLGKFDANWYTSKSLSLFNSVQYFGGTLGVRF